MSGRDDFAATLARIAASARATNGARAQELARALRQECAGELDAAGRTAAAQAAHQLAGSAGTFGDQDVVAPAQRLEAHFSRAEDPADGVQQEGLQADVRAVLAALGVAHEPGPHR